MGFFEDLKREAENFVSGASNTVNRELSNAGNSVNQNLDNATRGDVGKYTKEVVDAGLNVVKAPFEVIYYGVRGENKKASESIQRAIGSSINNRSNQNGNIYNPEAVSYRYTQTNEAQAVLRNPIIKEASLGISEDYAGFSRGSRTLQDSAYLSREDQNSAIRLGVKAGVFVAGSTAIDKLSANPTYSKLIPNKPVGYAALKAVSKGDYAGAVKTLSDGGYIPDVKDYVDLPQLPNAPSELTDLFDFLNPKSKTPDYLSNTVSTGTQINDPWDFSGIADSGISASKSSAPILIGGALILGLFIYSRIRK